MTRWCSCGIDFLVDIETHPFAQSVFLVVETDDIANKFPWARKLEYDMWLATGDHRDVDCETSITCEGQVILSFVSFLVTMVVLWSSSQLVQNVNTCVVLHIASA